MPDKAAELEAKLNRAMELLRSYAVEAERGISNGQIVGFAASRFGLFKESMKNTFDAEIIAQTVIRMDRWDRVVKAALAWYRARIMGDTAGAEQGLANAVANLDAEV